MSECKIQTVIHTKYKLKHIPTSLDGSLLALFHHCLDNSTMPKIPSFLFSAHGSGTVEELGEKQKNNCDNISHPKLDSFDDRHRCSLLSHQFTVPGVHSVHTQSEARESIKQIVSFQSHSELSHSANISQRNLTSCRVETTDNSTFLDIECVHKLYRKSLHQPPRPFLSLLFVLLLFYRISHNSLRFSTSQLHTNTHNPSERESLKWKNFYKNDFSIGILALVHRLKLISLVLICAMHVTHSNADVSSSCAGLSLHISHIYVKKETDAPDRAPEKNFAVKIFESDKIHFPCPFLCCCDGSNKLFNASLGFCWIGFRSLSICRLDIALDSY